ncbi:hypothetical protein VCUG_00134 [Vavraia culicis subsp. floridensis]|uniref:Uncharacterized protein n=1 Tax=Vavraia culicis (isolate floridensis) TaxID=948595 RepID=L2GYD6_VAVCU|nr:uncharacterized protein VCUG_00134 [Vavraia culicis subsp. floridensis]ELA48298.1 hypothetical protein VCUG_00134 [Vavraia culicis subsp. floridensis]
MLKNLILVASSKFIRYFFLASLSSATTFNGHSSRITSTRLLPNQVSIRIKYKIIRTYVTAPKYLVITAKWCEKTDVQFSVEDNIKFTYYVSYASRQFARTNIFYFSKLCSTTTPYHTAIPCLFAGIDRIVLQKGCAEKEQI